MVQSLTDQQIEFAIRQETAAWLTQVRRRALEAVKRLQCSANSTLPRAAFAAILLLGVATLQIHRPTTAPKVARLNTTRIHVVIGTGDSLWSLARKYGDPNVNVQERVETLARANGIDAGRPLLTGQKLVVPVMNPVAYAQMQTTVASR